MRGQQLFF